MIRTLARVAALTVLAGCSMLPGIQQDEAIAIALRNSPVAHPVVIDVEETPVLWWITLQGGVSICLAIPGEPQCVERLTTRKLPVDKETGEIMGNGFGEPER